MASTYTPIATQTLGSPASSVTFSSIPQTYTDLVLVVNASQGNSTINQGVFQVGNGSLDTGSNYSWTVLAGNGSTATSARGTNDSRGYLDYYAAAGDSNNPQSVIANFQNYSNTTTYKTVLDRAGKASNGTEAIVSLWRSTSAINIIKVYLISGNTYNTGSTFTLYGIKAA